MLKLAIALAALLLLSGCNSNSDLALPSVEEFCQQVEQEYSCVEKISIREWPWGVDCFLTLSDASDTTAQQLLEECQDFLTGSDFLKEYLPDPDSGEKMPDLSVLIDVDGDGVADIESSASYFLPSEDGEEQLLDRYQTWTDPDEKKEDNSSSGVSSSTASSDASVSSPADSSGSSAE